ncbi:hypothetical protein BT69DRAFT_842600 [Atractiella rhizophila]|nr:hypothetical protein BT69DRAFT_842600 [Atractiella rhizophila]
MDPHTSSHTSSSSPSPPPTQKLRSCDSCRMRRVKCVREPVTNDSCKQCLNKGIRCTMLQQVNPRRKMVRLLCFHSIDIFIR